MTLQAEQNAANDSSPAVKLNEIIKRLKFYFGSYFRELEDKVSKKFTQRAKQSATVSLKNMRISYCKLDKNSTIKEAVSAAFCSLICFDFPNILQDSMGIFIY